ncbi:MAG: septum formation initiator family protein [bacterium]|nr:septum formation initiator family protein [Alphaproteobacteria bacterium]MDI1364202.1 septum formation initiator family protein [bacterium]
MFARLQPILPTAAILFLIFYFVFHALTGERGLLSTSRRNADFAAKTKELKKIHAERMDLEARARLLRSGSLSADLLEERARSLLGYADPKDYVIRTKR